MIRLRKIGITCALLLIGSVSAITTVKAGTAEKNIVLTPTQPMIDSGIKTLRLVYEIDPQDANNIQNISLSSNQQWNANVLKATFNQEKTRLEIYVSSTTALFEKDTDFQIKLRIEQSTNKEVILKAQSLDMVTDKNEDFATATSTSSDAIMNDVIENKEISMTGGTSDSNDNTTSKPDNNGDSTTPEKPSQPNIGVDDDIIGDSNSSTGGEEVEKPTTNYRMDISKLNISSIASKTYTGKAIKPDVTITYGILTLEKGKDYTITYQNNVNAGTATAIIEGINDYRGSVTKTFVIKKASLTKAKVSSIPAQAYTKKAIKPSVTVTYGKTKLKVKKEYTLTYKNNKKVGKATITIKGTGNYTGTKNVTFQIKKNIANTKISMKTKYSYTGKLIKPNVTIKDGKNVLKKNKDYTISYKNNRKVGKGTVTIKGKGTYAGTKTVKFTIVK